MDGTAWLGLIVERGEAKAKFVVRSYDKSMKPGSTLIALSGAEVKIDLIRVRDFEPNLRATMTKEELDHYKTEQTTPGQNWILEVVGDIDGFNENEEISVKSN